VRHGSFALCVCVAGGSGVFFVSGVGYIPEQSAQAPFSLHLDGSPRGHFKRDFALVRSFSYYSGSSQCSPALFANQAEDEKEKSCRCCYGWACRAANSLFPPSRTGEKKPPADGVIVQMEKNVRSTRSSALRHCLLFPIFECLPLVMEFDIII
jgi:hypothetical protein